MTFSENGAYGRELRAPVQPLNDLWFARLKRAWYRNKLNLSFFAPHLFE